MNPVTIVSTIPVKAEHVGFARTALQQFAAATRGAEGCLGFDLYESDTAAGTFVTLARWVDREAYDVHRASPEVAAAMAGSQALVSGPPAIHPLVPVDVAD